MSEENAGPAADPAPEGRAMHIGEVAARTDLSLRTLRHWDEVGLLRPSGRSDGGFRLYTERDVDRILLIRRMKPLGFSLEEMGLALADLDLLADDPDPAGAPGAAVAAARERLAAVQAEASARREKLVRQLAMADEFLDLLGRRLP